jgi:hypothetical protein
VTKKSITLGLLAALSTLMTAGCGQTSQGPSPTQITIVELKAASGRSGVPSSFSSGILLSDVLNHTDGIFDDFGQVTMSLHLKDPGAPGINSAPTPLNDVTFTRYRVAYRRADGRNTPGVDVPYGFDGAATFTVVGSQGGVGVFELVRHVAKAEAPLAALVNGPTVITTFADVTFYGKDQAGNNVTVAGIIQVNFADFGDPST